MGSLCIKPVHVKACGIAIAMQACARVFTPGVIDTRFVPHYMVRAGAKGVRK
jgi:hypothetical protein